MFIFVFINSKFLLCPQKQSCENQLIHRCLTRTKLVGIDMQGVWHHKFLWKRGAQATSELTPSRSSWNKELHYGRRQRFSQKLFCTLCRSKCEWTTFNAFVAHMLAMSRHQLPLQLMLSLRRLLPRSHPSMMLLHFRFISSSSSSSNFPLLEQELSPLSQTQGDLQKQC